MTAPTVALVVPRRTSDVNDGPRRDALWAWCKAWWLRETDWPIYEGHHEAGEAFNISAARNRGAEHAIADHDGKLDVVVFLDSDVVLAHSDQARRAVAVAHRTGRWTAGHDRWCSINRPGTDLLMKRGVVNEKYFRTRNPMSNSNFIAVPVPLLAEVGGFDERFLGWAPEDGSFMCATKAVGGGIERVHGDVLHLHHARAHERQEGHPLHEAGVELAKPYKAAQNDPDAMRLVLADAVGWKHPDRDPDAYVETIRGAA